MAPAFAEPATQPPIVFQNVQLLDLGGPSASLSPDMSVLVEDGRIAKIARSRSLKAPADAVVIEGRGRILMPGLVDMHVHLWDQAALGAYLAHGITTVRNASGMPFHLRLARRIESGDLAGPRVVTTGPILNSDGPNAQIIHQIVTTEEEGRAAVRAQHAAGFRRLKVYSNLTADAWRGIREEANALGLTIMGHSPEGRREAGMPRDRDFNIPFTDLLDADFVTFEHMETIVWHALRDRHDEAAARELARKIATAGVAVDPTLVAFNNLLRVAETKGAYLQRPGVETLNPLVVAQEQPNYDRWSNESVEPNRRAFDFYKRATRIFADSGVVFVAGSDSGIFSNPPGVSLVDELQLLVEAGLSPFEALKAATYNAAVALEETDNRGEIAEGQIADMILLNSNPLIDVRAAGRPAMVVAEGRLYDHEDLRQLLKAARAPSLERTQRNVVEGLAAQGADAAALRALSSQ
jgi:imidazolonepropionase-like amidohydrolase